MKQEKQKTKRGIKAALVPGILLLGLMLFAFYGLFSNLSPPSAEKIGGFAAIREGRSQGLAVERGDVIGGTIRIAPSLAGEVSPGTVLFIIARKGEGPPLAVKRVPHPSFPLPYTLGPEDLIMPGTAFEGKVFVLARVKKEGTASPPGPGDLEGAYPQNPVDIGTQHAQPVDIVIDKRY